MNQQQTIEQALSEITLAEELVNQARQKYYSAKRKLESLYSPASPKRVKGLTAEQAAKIDAKVKASRIKTVIRNKPRKVTI